MLYPADFSDFSLDLPEGSQFFQKNWLNGQVLNSAISLPFLAAYGARGRSLVSADGNLRRRILSK